jgi:hypothetical protein
LSLTIQLKGKEKMSDFFDDFGWEEMAFWGSLADEMAEEERERRRLEREMSPDPEDDAPDDEDDCFEPRQPY